MHINPWLYSKSHHASPPGPLRSRVIPSRSSDPLTSPQPIFTRFTTRYTPFGLPQPHSSLYCLQNFVPYAFGAFYSNMLEAFLVDVISTFFALSVAALTTRQAMWFVTLSVLKAVDDHCGYAIPWDPFQWVTPQNALYHDIHHQAWGIKVCIHVPLSLSCQSFSAKGERKEGKSFLPLNLKSGRFSIAASNFPKHSSTYQRGTHILHR